MSRSSHKQVSVPESVLIVLLSGKMVSLDEITTTLQGKLVVDRIPTYMWELKKKGAVITPTKIGNKIVGYTLTNPQVMLQYLANRKAAGALIPDLQYTPTVVETVEATEELVTV